MKKQKREKNYHQWFDDFFVCVFTLITTKNSHAHSKKIVKTLMEIFRQIKVLTENTIFYDVTFSVILGTV